MMLPSTVWRIVVIGIGSTRCARSVTRICPFCGRTGAFRPKSGAKPALPSPAARTTLGAPISPSAILIRKSPGAALASLTAVFEM